jgi:hypothetical protein
MRILASLIATAAVLAIGASAQSRMTSGTHGSGPAAPHVGPRPSHAPAIKISGAAVERRGFRRPFRNNGFAGGYGWPYFYDDYAESYEPEAAPMPQPAAAAAPVQVKAEPVPDPVLLELRGNQWVKVESFTSAPAAAPVNVFTQQQVAVHQSAPAVLVYRDGHSEELSSYSIIGPLIYTKDDYWSSGNWTRKIQIADLDLPATLKQNQDRGVKFELPSGPDEVMIRP